MKMLLVGALAGAMMIGSAGAAQKTHLTAYQAYTEAKAAGDVSAARRYAEAAWRAAEDELGDHETTAILAQNFLTEVLWVDTERAADAAKRALILGRAGLGLDNMPLSELEIADAYAEAYAKPYGRNQRRRLVDAIGADRATGRLLGAFGVQAAQRAAMLAGDAKDYETAYAIATDLSAELEAVEGAPPALRAAADLQRAALLISQRKWKSRLGLSGRYDVRRDWKDRLKDGHVLIDAAINRFEPQEGIDDFDTVLGITHAWHGVVVALGKTHGVTIDNDWVFEGQTGAPTGPAVVAPMADGAPVECAIEWKDRKITYPREAMRDGYIGGVLLGYHLTADGIVTGARVLGEVPAAKFGGSILDQTDDWQAETTGLDPACLRDQTVAINFTFGR